MTIPNDTLARQAMLDEMLRRSEISETIQDKGVETTPLSSLSER